jgi:Uma2 family endonuclease
MATIPSIPPPFPDDWTIADMLAELGDVPVRRVRLVPLPGTATERDLLEIHARTGRACELIDGVLVEKTMGYRESLLSGAIIDYLRQYVRPRRLGIVLGEAGPLRILPHQVRMPDVCFIRYDRFPGGKLPQVQIPAVAPDLAVEVLSPDNSAGEMQRKLRDYFTAGVRLVWYVDPATRTARAYTAPDQCALLSEADTLSGGDVLPGFQLSLRDLFAEAEAEAGPAAEPGTHNG